MSDIDPEQPVGYNLAGGSEDGQNSRPSKDGTVELSKLDGQKDAPLRADPPSPSGKSRAQQNALGINIPPPSIASGPLTAPAATFPPPALRRTSSSLSGGSAGGGSGSREKKRLRFTPLVGNGDREGAGNSRGSPTSGSEDGWERDSDYDPEHGGSDTDAQHGKGGWRGYDRMTSDPGTPSLAETYVVTRLLDTARQG